MPKTALVVIPERIEKPTPNYDKIRETVARHQHAVIDVETLREMAECLNNGNDAMITVNGCPTAIKVDAEDVAKIIERQMAKAIKRADDLGDVLMQFNRTAP